MLDLQTHKDYLWKYLLTYGKARKKKDDPDVLVFPFDNILMEEGKTIEDYRSDAVKEKLNACSSLEEIYDFISLEYRDFYFLEISSLLHDDCELYSILLTKTMDSIGITDYLTANNYDHLKQFANAQTQQYISEKLREQKN